MEGYANLHITIIILCAWLLMRPTWWGNGRCTAESQFKQKHVAPFGVLLALTSSNVCQYCSMKSIQDVLSLGVSPKLAAMVDGKI